MVDMDEILYTREEAATVFKVSPRTIDRWIRIGALRRADTPGNVVRIPRSEIDRILRLKEPEEITT